MNRHRAAAALLAGVLAVALPAAAVVVPKFSGAKSGAASPDGTTLPHGASGAAGRGGRVPHPELLRDAADPAGETLYRRAQEAADAAAREQAAQAQPWAAAPHLRVRLTGDPVADAALLKALNAELATRVDPDRVRAGTLADDALADDALARLLPRRPDAAQQRLWKFLRAHPPRFDLYRLTQALRPLQGDTLLVMGHIDARDGALVFKAANGRLLRLPVALFQQAARDAGVQLVTIGCKSARHASAGFVDDLNGLDAARAMARAVHARPSTLFELFGALSSEQMVMQFDAQTFSATHTADVTAGPDGAALSTLHWNGPPVSAAAAPAASATETTAEQPGPTAAALWSNPALPGLGAAVLLSLGAGAVVARGASKRGGSVAARLALDALGHLLLLPLLLTVLAESVAGPSAFWWAWIGGLALALLALGCGVIARFDQTARDHQGLWFLMAARAAIAALPLMAVALLHTGWLAWPAPVMQALLALYGLGRPLPHPGLLIGGAFVLVWIVGWAMDGVEAVQHRRNRGRDRAGRLALWREQLAADGVMGAAARAALSARQAFDRRCETPVERVARWDQVKSLTDGHAPDPWAGRAQRHWRLVAVPLMPQAERDEPQAGFGLIRVGSPFMHPLPPPLVQRWREQDLREADLPLLLAQVEPRLVWSDFVAPGQLPRLTRVILFGAVFAGLFGGLALWMEPGSGERLFCAVVGTLLLALLVLWPVSIRARRGWRLRWLQRVRFAPPRAKAPPPAAAVAS